MIIIACIGGTFGAMCLFIMHLVLPKNKKIEAIEKEMKSLPSAAEVASLKSDINKLSTSLNELEKKILGEIHNLSQTNLKTIGSLDHDFITEKEFATRVALLINQHQETCKKR